MKNKYKNLSLAPFTYLTPSLNNIFLAIIVLLIPQLIMLFITKSYSSLINILMCIIASTFAEFLTNNILQKKSTYLTLNINATSGCDFDYFFDDKNNFKNARKLFLQKAFNNV